MAVQTVPTSRAVVLVVQRGVDAEGNPVFSSITYGGLKPEATLDGMWAFAQAVAGLQKYPLNRVGLVDRAYLVQA